MRCALFALNSKTPTNDGVVIHCKMLVFKFKEKGLSVKFFWIPSHIGISLYETADDLAKEATKRPFVDIDNNMSLSRIKKGMRKSRNIFEAENAFKILEEGSASMRHYLYVSQNTHITYGKNLSKIDTCILILKLGYNYCWQYIDGNGIVCRLCGEASSHTLEHYMLDCCKLLEFRGRTIDSVTEMACFFLNNNIHKKRCVGQAC